VVLIVLKHVPIKFPSGFHQVPKGFLKFPIYSPRYIPNKSTLFIPNAFAKVEF
jgi:hypothetical protein